VSKGADQPLSTPLRTAEDTHGPQGLGYAQLPQNDRRVTAHNATEAWVRAAHAYPGELIGLVTGPMTNLALALRVEPALPSLLRRLVIMGGSFEYRGNTDVVAEWNISVDPEAAAESVRGLVRSRNSANHIGAQTSPRTFVMTPAILTRLADAAGSSTVAMSVLDARGTRSGASNPLVRVLEDAMRFYFEFPLRRGRGIPGAPA